MKKLFILQDSLANKISYYHLLLLLVSLPFDMIYSHIILISFALHTLIQLDTKRVKSIFTKRNLILQSVFWVTILSTIYTINKPEAFNEWGRQLTILLVPLLLNLTNLDLNKYRLPLILNLSISSSITIVYLYSDALRTIIYYGLPWSDLFTDTFTNHNFSEPIAIHATFLSMQLIIALMFTVLCFIREQNLTTRLIQSIGILILTAGLLQLCSKSALFAAFVAINIIIPFIALTGTRRRTFLLIGGLLSVCCLAGLFTLNTFRGRTITSFTKDLATPQPGKLTDERMARWQTGVGLIKQSPVIGHGAGSEIGLLHEQFFIKKYYNSFLNHLNVHSQYLSFLIKSGIIGLLVYLTTLAFGFREALKRKDALFLSFMLTIAVVSFSENLLDVDKGIVFYAVFFSMFIFSNSEISRTNIQPTGNRSTTGHVIITEHYNKEIVAH